MAANSCPYFCVNTSSTCNNICIECNATNIATAVEKLRQCYLDIAEKIICSAKCSGCDLTKNVDEEWIFTRDLLWMTINVINMITDNTEKCTLINKIATCNGLCKGLIEGTYHDCGCS